MHVVCASLALGKAFGNSFQGVLRSSRVVRVTMSSRVGVNSRTFQDVLCLDSVYARILYDPFPVGHGRTELLPAVYGESTVGEQQPPLDYQAHTTYQVHKND